MALNQLYIRYAQDIADKYDFPASVMLAQFIVESKAGTSSLAKKSNNCFGIKGTGPAGSCGSFRAYNSKKESFEDYAKVITQQRYMRYNKNVKDPYAYVDGLVKGGYCPDAGYAQTIKNVIKNSNLTRYDTKTTDITQPETVNNNGYYIKDIVDIAQTQIGTAEDAGNRTKYGAYTGTNGQAWCCAFVAWCAHEANVSTSVVPKLASCDAAVEFYKSKGVYHTRDGFKPQRGDIIFFLYGSNRTYASHTGIVESSKNGKVNTIEGNSSNHVRRRSYALSKSSIVGYARPAYTSLNGSSSGVPQYSNSARSSYTASDKKKASAEEIAYLKKILSKHESKSKDITDLKLKKSTSIPKCEVHLLCKHGKKTFELDPEEGMTLEWERRGSPGTLKFKAPFSKNYKTTEGDKITLMVDGVYMFSGFIFKKSRSANSFIDYTVYDSLRYLKNKDTMVISNKRADQIIKLIAKRYSLTTAKLPNTKIKMSVVEDDAELFDIINDALDRTMMSKDTIYVLYDYMGKLTLKNISKMKINECLIDADTGEDFTYVTSIDDGVYNQVKLVNENTKKKKYNIYIARDSKNIAKWGVLQYVDKLDDASIGKMKANAYLKLYNQKKRTLTISGVIGNPKVRAGCLVPVIIELDDLTIANYMLVEKVTHKFSNRKHEMELMVSGGGFSYDE